MAAFNRNLSAIDLVKRVVGQLGLPQPQVLVGNPNDRTANQMLALLNSAGSKLLKPVNGHRWQQFQLTWALQTVIGQTTYPLPLDYDSFIDSTAQSKSLAQPLIGPVSPQGWSLLRAQTGGPTISLMYRLRGGKLELFHAPAAVQDLTIDYTSRAWVQATAQGAFKDEVTADDDVVLYDSDLIQAALKLEFLQAKGFDTTTAQNNFDLALELAINTDSDAAIINCGGSYRGMPLLGVGNVPETGIGL